MDTGFLIDIVAVAACVIMFVLVDEETRRSFCWIIILVSIFGVAWFLYDPGAWFGH